MNLMPALGLLTVILVSACHDSKDKHTPVEPAPEPAPDFSNVDQHLEDFINQNPAFSGASIVLVDKEDGAIHEEVFGDHSLDTIVLLASVSKMTTASLLMALADDDDKVNFEIDEQISNYLPWQGVWPGVTTKHLLSNRSGIPGIDQLGGYGAHLCQIFPVGQLQTCGQIIYQTPLPDLISSPANTAFDYGGSQWQLAGAVAEIVGGASFAQLFDQYIAGPCELEIFRYGNNLTSATDWDGNVDSLVGLDNPNAEAGAASNLSDYAKLLSMHLNDGSCGDTQVLSKEAVEFMRIERSTPADTQQDRGYAMGWWVKPALDGDSSYLYFATGVSGPVAWIDLKRNYGGYVALEDYALADVGGGTGMVVEELIPLIEQALDAVAE
ncbi:MAG: serine hydrolase [Halioglobus sp.]